MTSPFFVTRPGNRWPVNTLAKPTLPVLRKRGGQLALALGQAVLPYLLKVKIAGSQATSFFGRSLRNILFFSHLVDRHDNGANHKARK